MREVFLIAALVVVVAVGLFAAQAALLAFTRPMQTWQRPTTWCVQVFPSAAPPINAGGVY